MKILIKIKDKKFDFNLDINNSILDIKNQIISKYFENKDIYIDLEYLSDKPLRLFGKYTLNPGVISRNHDLEKFNKFSIKENIILKVIRKEKSLIIPKKRKKNKYFNQTNKYFNQTNNLQKKEFIFRESDFPSLS